MNITLSLSSGDIYAIPKADEPKYVSREVAAFIKKTIAEIFRRFPEAKKYFKGVRYTKRMTSSLEPFERKLVISVLATEGTVDDAQRIQSQGNKVGFHVHGEAHEAFTSLIVHEMGHFIDLAVKLKFKNNDDALIEYQQAKRTLHKMLGNPSPYAATHEGEWVAEQFTVEHMGRGDGPLSVLIQKFLKDTT